jgi:hypothetical protein
MVLQRFDRYYYRMNALHNELYSTPLVNFDRKPEPSYYPALAAFDIKVDRKLKFPVSLLAIATVCRTIANARLQSELTKGCTMKGITVDTERLAVCRQMQRGRRSRDTLLEGTS